MSEFRNEPHTVVDDVPKCRTEYEEKCEYTQVLHCTVLHCTVLYYTVLYCTVLYCTHRSCREAAWPHRATGRWG